MTRRASAASTNIGGMSREIGIRDAGSLCRPGRVTLPRTSDETIVTRIRRDDFAASLTYSAATTLASSLGYSNRPGTVPPPDTSQLVLSPDGDTSLTIGDVTRGEKIRYQLSAWDVEHRPEAVRRSTGV